MIAKISGKIVEKKENAVILDVHGVCYEIIVPASVLGRMDELTGSDGNVGLVIYHYLQIGPSSGVPFLIGFANDLERDFFLQFIKVSGIGPRAAVKALDKPISEITAAIEGGDVKFLTTLPGIGAQRAKEIVAKLQGKIGRFGLIRDKAAAVKAQSAAPAWQEEALQILTQLQYKKSEAEEMIGKALERRKDIETSEELLNEIYKQKVRG